MYIHVLCAFKFSLVNFPCAITQKNENHLRRAMNFHCTYSYFSVLFKKIPVGKTLPIVYINVLQKSRRNTAKTVIII